MAFLDGYRVKMKDERQTDEGQQHFGLTIMRYACFTRWQPCGKRFDNNNRGGRPLNLKRPFTYMCKLIIRLNRSPHFPTPHRMKINLNSHFSIEFDVVYCVMISVYVCRCSRYLSRALYLSLSLALSSFISFICRFLLFNYIRHMAFGVAQTLTRFTNTKLANGVYCHRHECLSLHLSLQVECIQYNGHLKCYYPKAAYLHLIKHAQMH